jgi:predicted nucleotide-binding protein (sugar kinase/HSP70/actin superfamily)
MTYMAIPNIGNYTIALATAVESLGIKAWASTATTPEALKLGISAAPESVCLPLKAHLGHFIEADRAGVEFAFMVNSVGTCRLRYYRHMIGDILRDLGLKIKIFGLGFDGFKPPIVRYFDPGPVTFLKPILHTALKIKVIDELEVAAWRTRPVEIIHGDTTRVMNRLLAELSESGTMADTRAIRKKAASCFAEIPVDREKQPLRVGLVGEISFLRDKCLNKNIEYILGSQGIEVRNFFLLGEELNNISRIVLLNQNRRKYLSRIADRYLQSTVGGHALDSVAHSIRCADEGYDGMVHLCPSGCMPEVSVRPILKRVSRDKDFPILEMSYDEHTCAVGIATRLEAFADVLRERRKKQLPRPSRGEGN